MNVDELWLSVPVGEIAEPHGETMCFPAHITGEIKPVDIPIAADVDINAIKAGDDASLEIVAAVPATKSKRGWDYKPEAIMDIVNHVNAETLSGFLGHQKAENLETEFPMPVAHWVGAKWDDEKKVGYFRGIIDPAAENLKRWIRSKRVREVSIYGMPKLQKTAGKTEVVGYSPLSIDFVPIGRPGMPTAIVATGEMNDEVIGEGETINGGEISMTWKEIVEKLKTMLAAGDVTFGQVAGEMGWKAQDVAGEIDAQWLKDVTGAVEILGKVKEALGVSGEMDVLEVAEEAKKAMDEMSKAGHEALISEVLKEKVAGEMAQGLVRKMLHVADDATKEQIAGEIDKLLEDETVKAAVGKFHVDKPAVTGGSGSNEATTLRVKRQGI